MAVVIQKNTTSFNVTGNYSVSWFKHNVDNNGPWENSTFHILDAYANRENGVYVDIGAWIGPTVLYAASRFKKLLAVEPDPVARDALNANIKCNTFNNITIVPKAISDKDGVAAFGGNGPLGNSESTLLVGVESDFRTNYGRNFAAHDSISRRMEGIISVETTTLSRVLSESNISPSSISLIKIDIEGGEIIVIPAILPFLTEHKPSLFISLHRCFLSDSDVDSIVNRLFNIYPHCYIFSDTTGAKTEITRDEAISKKHASLVFDVK